jgi:hypothetical protein
MKVIENENDGLVPWRGPEYPRDRFVETQSHLVRTQRNRWRQVGESRVELRHELTEWRCTGAELTAQVFRFDPVYPAYPA